MADPQHPQPAKHAGARTRRSAGTAKRTKPPERIRPVESTSAARHTRPAQHKSSVLPIILSIAVVVGLIAGGVALAWHFLRPNQPGTVTNSASETLATTTAPTNNSGSTTTPQATAPTEEQHTDPAPISVEPATIQVMMVGDVLMHDELVDSGYQGDGSYDFSFVFDNIRDEISAADLRILNQETVMGEPDMGYHLYMGSAGPIMNTPTALADAEAQYGFNLILKATNHTLDRGYSGLAHELNYWRDAHPEIPVVGVDNPDALYSGDDSQDYVNNVYIYEHNGMKVGILNYTWATNENVDWGTDTQVISYLSDEKIREDVQKARDAGAEMLIACPHWGIEYDTTPSDEENHYSTLFCELGVDLILGAHPHILQPVEVLRNEQGHKTVCFFSLGNYVAASLMSESSLIGGIARATLQRNADGTYAVAAASLVPTVICHTYGPHMSAFPLTAYTYDLAAESSRPALTPDYAYSFCENVLGPGFDPATGIFTLDVSQEGRLV